MFFYESESQPQKSASLKTKMQECADVLDGAHIKPTVLSLWGCLFGTDTKRSLQ